MKKNEEMFAVYLCPTRNTLLLITVERAVRTHRCHCAESNVQCASVACGWSGTKTSLTIVAKTSSTCQQCTLVWLV